MPLTWPPSLPQTPLLGWSKEMAETRLRTQTDTGPAKVRRQFTAGVIKLQNVVILVDDTQRTTFETFFDTTTAGGSLRFDWVMPDSGAAVEMRFLDPPQIVALNHQAFRISMSLEVLP